MAFTAGYLVQWSDVQNLYTQTNTQRSRWGLGAVTVPGNPGLTLPSQVQALKTAIEDLKTTSAGNTANTGVTVPARGDLLKPDPFNRMQNTLNNLAAANANFNSSFNSNFNSSFNSSFNASFNSSFNSSHCSFGHASNGCNVFYSRPSCGTTARNSFSK